jgi:hypothetical protein
MRMYHRINFSSVILLFLICFTILPEIMIQGDAMLFSSLLRIVITIVNVGHVDANVYEFA